MRSLPRRAQAYIIILWVATGLLAALSVFSLNFNLLVVLEVVIFSLAICVADLYPILIPSQIGSEVTISGALKAAAVIIFGPYITILVTLIGTLLAEVIVRRTWYKAAFNSAEMVLTFAGMSMAYELIYDGVRTPFHSLQNAGALGCIVIVYLAMNSGLVTTIVSLTTGVHFAQAWKANILDYLWHNLTIIPLGAVLGALWLYRPWSVLALALPMVAVRQSFQFIADLRRETLEALANMADLVDQRDPSTYQHSQRVASIAEAVAQELGLAHEDVDNVRMAARLHDVGKIGMNDALLYKPGKFDESEIRRFRLHAELGARMADSFHLYPEVQNLILHHHERYDGKGYPDGLAGEAIPLGSRILAVADSFDAMTSKRIYRSSLSQPEAMDEVLRNRVTQFDPMVVDAFISVSSRLGGAVPWLEDQTSAQSAPAAMAPFAVLQPAGSFAAPQADPAPSRATT